MIGAAVTQALHLALLLALAPLITGGVRTLKARLMGRRGPHPLQAWRDLRKLVRKQPVRAETATAVTEWAPVAALAATALAAALVPSFARGMAFAGLSDLLLIAGLLAVARAALALAALDAGTAFGGLGAARGMAFAAFAEPALLVGVLSVAILVGTTNLDAASAAMAEGTPGLRVSLALVGLALLAVALAETARMPVDDPAMPFELTMTREAMLLEASARELALWEAQGALRLVVWLALLAALFLPFGAAPAGAGPLAWLLGLAAFLAKIAALAAALAVFESAIAKLRVFRVPEFLGAALALALLAALLLFVSTGLA